PSACILCGGAVALLRTLPSWPAQVRDLLDSDARPDETLQMFPPRRGSRTLRSWELLAPRYMPLVSYADLQTWLARAAERSAAVLRHRAATTPQPQSSP